MKTILNQFEDYLETIYKNNDPMAEQLNYPLLAGGKRFRPMLLICLYQDLFPNQNIQTIFPIAAAIEMIHTYSLVHDDLPAMDDDNLRRGKPTTHIKYNEATAILVGDGLLTDAFELITESTLSNSEKVGIIRKFSQAAGTKGMIYGQLKDMDNQFSTITQIEEMHHLKTGVMIELPAQVISILNVKGQKILPIFELIGKWFQLHDDIIDQTSSTKQLGKPQNSDLKNQKINYISLIGLQKAIEYKKNIEQKILTNPNIQEFPTTRNYLMQFIKE